MLDTFCDLPSTDPNSGAFIVLPPFWNRKLLFVIYVLFYRTLGTEIYVLSKPNLECTYNTAFKGFTKCSLLDMTPFAK